MQRDPGAGAMGAGASRAAGAAGAWEAVTFGAGAGGLARGARGAPGVLLLQEWWGVTPEIRAQAEVLEAAGFRVLIPDLYNGKIGVDAEEASHLMGNLDWPKARDELVAAARFLREEGSPRVGTLGFCMGGALSLVGAQWSPDVSCAVAFYGTPGRELCQPETIKKPIQGHFGELDGMEGFSDPAAAKALAVQLQEAGCGGEVFSYPGVGHAFMNANPDAPEVKEGVTASTGFPPKDEAMQSLAAERVEKFLLKHLAGAQ